MNSEGYRKCRINTQKGHPCKRDAVYGDYCSVHWFTRERKVERAISKLEKERLSMVDMIEEQRDFIVTKMLDRDVPSAMSATEVLRNHIQVKAMVESRIASLSKSMKGGR